MDAHTLAALAGIICLDLLLSGDNAVVIAVICNGLQESQRRIGLILGIVGAMVMRVAGTLVVDQVLGLPAFCLAIGGYLLFVAVKLVAADEAADGRKPSSSLFGAVLAVACADFSMSMDNVAAIAALAHGHAWLMTFGIVLSIILMAIGATLIMKIVERFPVTKWAGAAFLGWIAGTVISHDSLVARLDLTDVLYLAWTLPLVGLLGVIGAASMTRLVSKEA